MATGFLDIQIVGDYRGVQGMLRRLDTALNPIAIGAFLNVSVEPWLRERAENRFKSEGDDVSGSWAPLQPSTQEIRARGQWPVGPDHPINRRTGELEAYITKSASVITPHALGATLTYPKPTTKKSVVQKMKTAQTGRSSPSTVKRPVLGVNEKDLLHVLTTLAFHIKGGKQ